MRSAPTRQMDGRQPPKQADIFFWAVEGVYVFEDCDSWQQTEVRLDELGYTEDYKISTRIVFLQEANEIYHNLAGVETLKE